MSFIESIEDRLKLGKEKYGHGVIIEDDTTKYGTKSNSWLEMGEEELLDCCVYLATDYLKIKGFKGEINDEIIKLLTTYEGEFACDAYIIMIQNVIRIYKKIKNERLKR